MSDLEARRFRRNLTAVLSLVGLLTAGSVFLFGHLLFKTLSKDVIDEALLYSRQDAQRIARGLAERAAGDVYTLKVQQKDVDVFVGSALSDRQVLSEVRVYDSKGQLVYAYTGLLSRPERVRPHPEGGQTLGADPVEPSSHSGETITQITDPYGIEVPIGDFGTLKVGVSQRELETRVEVLRGKLYTRIFAAALVSFLGILAASWAVMLLVRRTRKVEAARVEAERRAELGEVATGLAHEIRNPLNAMSLNLELLEEQLAKGSSAVSAAELAQATRVETGRLARLLADFLSYARPSPLVTVPSDLNEPAAEAVTFLRPEARSRRISLEFKAHDGGAPALLDAARVKQVVLNLVGNALDAVETVGATAREVDVAIEDGGRFWLLTVTDRGPGFDQKNSDIFRVFVSTKPAGTGMGLPIAERIVKAHGGELTLASKKGEPTRAVATFPKA
jgi:signal transduction histidine kinase